MIYIACDTDDLTRAKELAKTMSDMPVGIKLGMTFFAANGPDGIRAVHEVAHQPIFLDMKYHDIPAQVAGAVESCCRLPIAILNIHASGGSTMMSEAAKARNNTNPNVALIAVTVLTSMDETDREALGWVGPTIADQVTRWAQLTKKSGLDGVVCSPHEIAQIRLACGPTFQLVTPGVRPIGADLNDQKRVMTPGEAMKAGSTHLVIGRPITGAENPAAAARAIMTELNAA